MRQYAKKLIPWRAKEAGLTLPEIVITLSVTGVLAAIVAPTLTAATNPLNDTVSLLEGNFKLARSKAMSQTTAYRIRPDGDNRLVMERHLSGVGTNTYSCEDADVDEVSGTPLWRSASGFNDQEDMAIAEGVTLQEVTIDGTPVSDLTDWQVCFDGRGMSNGNLVLTLADADAAQNVEVFSSGTLVAYDSSRYVTAGVSSPSGGSTGGASTSGGLGTAAPTVSAGSGGSGGSSGGSGGMTEPFNFAFTDALAATCAESGTVWQTQIYTPNSNFFGWSIGLRDCLPSTTADNSSVQFAYRPVFRWRGNWFFVRGSDWNFTNLSGERGCQGTGGLPTNTCSFLYSHS